MGHLQMSDHFTKGGVSSMEVCSQTSANFLYFVIFNFFSPVPCLLKIGRSMDIDHELDRHLLGLREPFRGEVREESETGCVCWVDWRDRHHEEATSAIFNTFRVFHSILVTHGTKNDARSLSIHLLTTKSPWNQFVFSNNLMVTNLAQRCEPEISHSMSERLHEMKEASFVSGKKINFPPEVPKNRASYSGDSV